MEDTMEHTISFIARHHAYQCNCYCSWYYNIKLLMNGKKIIVNGTIINTDLYGRNPPYENKINEKILYNDNIQLSKSQIDLLKLIYKSNSNGDFKMICTLTVVEPELKEFCEIIDDMKKNKDKYVFTREDIDGYNKIILNNKLILNKLKIETDKKNKILIDKINRIKHNILEKTIENNKLKLQLEDITEIYNLLLYKLK